MLLTLCAGVVPGALADETVSSGWSETVEGLRCRIQLPKRVYRKGEVIVVHVILQNVSGAPLRLIDLKDNPLAEASYWRGMLLGFRSEPGPFHLPGRDMFYDMTLAPGGTYEFEQRHDVAVELKAKQSEALSLTYDATNAHILSPVGRHSNVWFGRLVTPPIQIEVVE